MNLKLAITTVLIGSALCVGCERAPAELPKDQPTAVSDVGASPSFNLNATMIPRDQFMKERDPSNTALSPSEAAWMKDHGFISPADLASLDSLDVQKLHFESTEHGDMRAATLLGLKRAKDGDLSGASSALDRAARLGSLFAYEQLAVVDLQRAIGDLDREYNAANDPQRAIFAAQMEAARLRGDTQVGHYLQRYASRLDRSRYANTIQVQTDEFMRQYFDDLKTRGVAPPPVVARPGAAQWGRTSQPNNTQPISVFSW